MKTLYFECKMGAAGDMLMAALYEICDQKELFLQTMNQAFSEYGIQISAEESKKCGISGTHMHVMINGEEEGVHVHEHVHTHTHDHTEAEHVHTNEHEAAEHHHDESSHAHTHHSYQSVLAQIEHLQLPAQVKADAAAIYRLIGEAESAVPGILSGVILATGRVVGETAALLFTAGTIAKVAGLMDSGRTLAVHMYALSSEGLYMNQMYATGVILMLIVLLINGCSGMIAKKIAKK